MRYYSASYFFEKVLALKIFARVSSEQNLMKAYLSEFVLQHLLHTLSNSALVLGCSVGTFPYFWIVLSFTSLPSS